MRFLALAEVWAQRGPVNAAALARACRVSHGYALDLLRARQIPVQRHGGRRRYARPLTMRQQAILAALANGPATGREVAECIRVDVDATRDSIARLARAGRLQCVGERGGASVWALIDAAGIVVRPAGRQG